MRFRRKCNPLGEGFSREVMWRPCLFLMGLFLSIWIGDNGKDGGRGGASKAQGDPGTGVGISFFWGEVVDVEENMVRLVQCDSLGLVDGATHSNAEGVAFEAEHGKLEGGVLFEINFEGGRSSGFQTHAGRFAGAHGGVEIAEGEQGTRNLDGQVERGAGRKFAQIHVAAPGIGRGEGGTATALWGQADATDHGVERDGEAAGDVGETVFEDDGLDL